MIIKSGETIIIDNDERCDYEFLGLFVALKEIDTSSLIKRWVTESNIEVKGGSISGRQEMVFFSWLLLQSYFKKVDCKTLNLAYEIEETDLEGVSDTVKGVNYGL